MPGLYFVVLPLMAILSTLEGQEVSASRGMKLRRLPSRKDMKWIQDTSRTVP